MNRLELIKKGIENLSEEEFKKQFGHLIKKEKYFVPKENEGYYYVDSAGFIGLVKFRNDIIDDDDVMKYRKVFRTEQEALFERDKRQFLLQMECDFLDNSDDIDWVDHRQGKYFVFYQHECESIEVGNWNSIQTSCLITTNIEWLKQYVKDNEENILKYYFEIKGDK